MPESYCRPLRLIIEARLIGIAAALNSIPCVIVIVVESSYHTLLKFIHLLIRCSLQFSIIKVPAEHTDIRTILASEFRQPRLVVLDLTIILDATKKPGSL